MTVIERNQLVENYLPLANKLANQKKKVLPRRIDLDDLKSAAYYGLMDAARKFDATKNIAFGAYAKFRIMGEIQDFIRRSYRDFERCKISLDQPDENGNVLADSIAQKTVKSTDFFEDTVKQLSDLDKNVVTLYYVDDLSLKEIGLKIGVSESRVSQLLKRSKETVRTVLAA